MRAALSASEKVAVTSWTVPAAGDSDGAVLLARTVMIGVPVATFDCTTTLPPKIGCSAVRSAVTPDGVGDQAAAGLDREAGGDLLALGVAREQHRGGAGGRRRAAPAPSPWGDEVGVELLRLADVDLLGAVGGELLRGRRRAGAQHHRGRGAELAGERQQLVRDLLGRAVDVVDEDEDLSHVRLPLSDELLRREELDDLDAAVSLVLDDLTRAAGRLVGERRDLRRALARPT
jgi:hypothetical protein